jgi:hypothetical protein
LQLYMRSPLVIGQTKMVMSEPYFTTLTLIGLILTERYLVRKVVNPVASILTGTTLVLAIFTRNIGIVLIVAVAFRILVLPIEKATKQKVFIYLLIGGVLFLAAVIALTPVSIRSLLPIEYMDQFRDPHKWGQDQIDIVIVPRVVTALEEYVALHLRTAVIPIGGGGRELEFGRRLGIPNLPLLTGSLIGIFILLGILSAFQYRELSPTVLLFEIMYLAAILFWPWRAPRFLYPIIPFLFYNFLSGLKLIFNQFNRIKLLSRINPTAVGLAFVIFALSALSIFKVLRDHSTSLEYVRDLRVGAMWLKENSGKDDLVMAQQPQGIYLYSERKTMDFPPHYEFESAEDFESIVRNRGVDYIVIAPDLVWREDGLLEYDNFTGELILPVMNELNQTNSVEVVYSSEADKVIVYKVSSR